MKAESITAETLNTSVVQHNAYHLMESSTKVKTFWTAEAQSYTFIGREAELKSIHEKLQECCASQQHHMKRIVAVISAPGMGKTEIARDFVQKYKDQYENVVWIDARTESSARASLVNLARELKLEISQDDDGKALARLLYAHICSQYEKPFLLILDGAQGLRTDGKVFGIHDYLPTQVKRNLPLILITSRSNEWTRHPCEVVQVPPLSKEESFQFFQTVLRLSEQEEQDGKLNDLLYNLADKLQGHPVRLKKAEKFIISSIPDQHTVSTSSADKSISSGKSTLSRLKEKVRECIKKADRMEFSAELAEDMEVEQLPAQQSSASTLNSARLLASSKDVGSAMAGPSHNHNPDISLFKAESGKIGDDHASQDELMTKLAEKPPALQVQNKMQEILASHDAQLDSKLENVYDPDTVQVIQNELTADALKGMQDFLGELRKQLECRDRLLARVNANRERLEKEISAFMFETEKDFERALDPSKFCSEEELAQVELDSRSKAMEELKKFCRKVQHF